MIDLIVDLENIDVYRLASIVVIYIERYVFDTIVKGKVEMRENAENLVDFNSILSLCNKIVDKHKNGFKVESFSKIKNAAEDSDQNGSIKKDNDKSMLGKLGFKQSKDKVDKYKKKLDDNT